MFLEISMRKPTRIRISGMMIMQQMQAQMRPQIESLFEPFPLAIVQLTKIKVWMDGSTDTLLQRPVHVELITAISVTV